MSLHVVKLGSATLAHPAVFEEVAELAGRTRLLVVAGGAAGIARHYREIGREVPVLVLRNGDEVRYCPPEEMAHLVDAYERVILPDVAKGLAGLSVFTATGAAGLVTATPSGPLRASVAGRPRVVRDHRIGTVSAVAVERLTALLDTHDVVVLSPPVAADDGGTPLNLDADVLAAELATALRADHLWLVTGTAGLLADPADPGSTIAEAAVGGSWSARGRMRQKVRAAELALPAVADVAIMGPHALRDPAGVTRFRRAGYDVLRERAAEARRLVVDMAARPTGCHLGGSLSVVDVLVAAFDRADAGDGTEVVLSKGHAAAALYAVLHVSGRLAENPAPLYGAAGHPYTGHPSPAVPGVRFPTGSLGHGVPYAAGWALAQRLSGGSGLAIAVTGDGELQEGLVWESLQVAAARRLGNLVVVVDRNGGQNDGLVADISPLPDLAARFASFGLDVSEVDGHDPAALREVFAAPTGDRPRAVIAHTVKGRGVPAVEGRAGAHYAVIDGARAERWKRAVR
ncbi:1-deoxy-D-xylulose-5-phosphate synthase N-terminal domain-containing protein [Actinosynnema sp. NPDC059797]